jgi:hypothetical protein
VLVHLRPSPVVARVMSGTVVLHDDPELCLRREVAVSRFLAPTGLAVPPSPLIEPGPYGSGGLWLTFASWVAVDGRTEPDDAEQLGAVLRRLHAALDSSDSPGQGLGPYGGPNTRSASGS